MLVRQFSIRWLLLFTAVCAVVSLLVALSLDGNRWAAGVVTALASLLVVMVVHAVLFSLFWLATLAWPVDRRRGRPPVAPGRPSGTELAARGTTQ